ncbi:MAG: superoxide dismutase [Alphaproteobacteria bacterium]|nr:superoxide dismutase [Alphaproteobacteria bacterium]
MSFTLPDLPYAIDALEPHISKRTLEFHHGKHHAGYVSNLNGLVEGTKHESASLLDIVRDLSDDPGGSALYNNAAQTWNHTFFWDGMRPDGGGEPGGAMLDRLKKDFGSYDSFRDKFKQAATGQFGSGWAWLIESDGVLDVVSTGNAVVPVADGRTPLLTCDVWEHAYYLDYQNARADFVDSFLDHLVNWDFVESNLDAA